MQGWQYLLLGPWLTHFPAVLFTTYISSYGLTCYFFFTRQNAIEIIFKSFWFLLEHRVCPLPWTHKHYSRMRMPSFEAQSPEFLCPCLVPPCLVFHAGDSQYHFCQLLEALPFCRQRMPYGCSLRGNLTKRNFRLILWSMSYPSELCQSAGGSQRIHTPPTISCWLRAARQDLNTWTTSAFRCGAKQAEDSLPRIAAGVGY